jgi:hypothetical protein
MTAMADDMSDCPPASASEISGEGQSVSAVATVANQLPTLQRNALRKIFDRHEFTAEEVATLGYRRLQQAEGIGNIGLAAITEWFRLYGFELKPPELAGNPKQFQPKIMRRNIESAVRLLRTHSYVVQQEGDGLSHSLRTTEGFKPSPIVSLFNIGISFS